MVRFKLTFWGRYFLFDRVKVSKGTLKYLEWHIAQII